MDFADELRVLVFVALGSFEKGLHSPEAVYVRPVHDHPLDYSLLYSKPLC